MKSNNDENDAAESPPPQPEGTVAATALSGMAAEAPPQPQGSAATIPLSGIVDPGQNGKVTAALTCRTCDFAISNAKARANLTSFVPPSLINRCEVW
jgi:hypothetical protein